MNESDPAVGRRGARFPSAPQRRRWADGPATVGPATDSPPATPTPVARPRIADQRFDAALRGYDRRQVDEYVASLHREVSRLSERLMQSERSRVLAERGAQAAEEELARSVAGTAADAHYRRDVTRALRRVSDPEWVDPETRRDSDVPG